MLVRGLWGVQIDPQADRTIRASASFKITMASIYQFRGPERTSVYISFHDSKFLLCSLIPEKIEQQVMDITCLQGETITLRAQGPNVIHLLGNYISQDIDNQIDDDIEYTEVKSSAQNIIDEIQQEKLPSLGFPHSKKIVFDESDDYTDPESESISESISESESVPEYAVSHLTNYVNESIANRSSLISSKDIERYNERSATEGNMKYVQQKNVLKQPSDAIPKSGPSSIAKESCKLAKRQKKNLALELKQQQQQQQQQQVDDINTENEEAKTQQFKHKNKASGNDRKNQPNSPTVDPAQDIRSLVLGAFANMASTLQNLANMKTDKPTLPVDQNNISSAETDEFIPNAPPKVQKQNSSNISSQEGDEPFRSKRNPRKSKRTTTMNLALLAQDDADNADDADNTDNVDNVDNADRVRKERNKKRIQRVDNSITKKARLSIE
ncbi:hypothetical protein BD408DRAFT_420517 [Parasitella parasitica]|nr:hypothetical protein BD408DRAFT_420517 [Parasitella parasitica]